MSEMIELLDNIDETISRSRRVSLLVLIVVPLVCLTVCILTLQYAHQDRQSVYVLDHGKALLAIQSDATVTKDMEVEDHVARFHEIFFNLAPNAESIRNSMDKAFNLADRSAYDYYTDIAEKGYYNRMITANITQQIQVDSVLVNTEVYPYTASTYARLFVLREKALTVFAIESSCRVINTGRSSVNPHGLMIEGFKVVQNYEMETRKR